MHSVKKFLSKFLAEVGTSRALGHKMALDADDWQSILDSKVRHPSTYLSHHDYFADAKVVDITRKLRLPGDSERRRRAAIETFYAAEHECAKTNARMSWYMENTLERDSDMPVFGLIDQWRKELKRALGPAPWVLEPAFSGGSTLSDKGCLTTIPDKLSSVPTVYAQSRDLWSFNVRNTVLGSQEPLVVRSNRFFTVPKDSSKDRGCCVEASASLSLQLAVGKIMKRRYRNAYGVVLGQAKTLHMNLAQRGSFDGSLATIDLSNASDTVSRKLVELLLPPDWFALLNSLRASATQIDGQTVFLEKFSSMGNGFTFELETFLFRSLSAAIGCEKAWCFGDDIIVPTEKSGFMMWALQFFGFTPNPKKTFCDGPFRESCGGDYFNGKPVRAHFLEEIPATPQQWVSLANAVRRLDPMLLQHRASWRFCIDQLPTTWRNYGPEWLGDLVIWDPDAPPRTEIQQESGYATYYYIMRPIFRSFALEEYWKPDIVVPAYCLGATPEVTPRGEPIGYKRTRVLSYGLKPKWLEDYLSGKK